MGEPVSEGADSIERATGARVAEDAYLARRADEQRYIDKCAALRREAVVEALLAPARLLGIDVDSAAAAADDGGQESADEDEDVGKIGEVGAGDRGGAMEVASRRAWRTPVLGFLSDERPPTQRRARGADRHAREAARLDATLTADGFTAALHAQRGLSRAEGDNEEGPPRGDDEADAPSTSVSADNGASAAAAPPPTLLPLALPARSRAKLSARLCAAVPPTLVFVNSAAAAAPLKRYLSERLPSVRVAEVSSEVPESARAARLADFAAGRVRVLVSTNLAARGLDTAHVAHVIEAEFAGDAITHLHRVGRTARAGRAGLATSLVVRRDVDLVRALIAARASGHGVDAAFSSKRSFRRNSKRSALAKAEDAVVVGVLEREQQLLALRSTATTQ